MEYSFFPLYTAVQNVPNAKAFTLSPVKASPERFRAVKLVAAFSKADVILSSGLTLQKFALINVTQEPRAVQVSSGHSLLRQLWQKIRQIQPKSNFFYIPLLR